MDDIDLLEGVLTKTGGLVAGVDQSRYDAPTPCADYDVRTLVGHIVGWSQVFAAAARGEQAAADPASYQPSAASADDFRTAAGQMVDGWRTHGFDRTVRLTSGELPASMVFNMTLMEYLTHGWDLATATGQTVPFSDAEAEATLERAQQTLSDDYRGDAFGPRVEVPDDADALTRLVAFMGRTPI